MLVEMTVKGLLIDPLQNVPMVILRDADNQRALPIMVGPVEANAIAVQLENSATARPMTHDLLNTVINELGAAVEAIEVNDLKDNTFFATVRLRRHDQLLSIDSRPSDAISLALRTKSPIWVAKKVLEQSSVLQQGDEEKDQNLSNVSRDKWAEILEKMVPEDFKYKM